MTITLWILGMFGVFMFAREVVSLCRTLARRRGKGKAAQSKEKR